MTLHETITLNGASQNLAATLTLPRKGLVYFLQLQPDGANNFPVFVGGTGTAGDSVSSTDFGVRLPAGDTNDAPPAPWPPHDVPPGTWDLAQINVIGTNAEKLHVFWIPQV